MRNTVTQLLAPGISVTVKIEPPIGPDEMPYLFTIRGTMSAMMNVTSDNANAVITNPTDKISPVLFFVGPKTQDIPSKLMSALFRMIGSA